MAFSKEDYCNATGVYSYSHKPPIHGSFWTPSNPTYGTETPLVSSKPKFILMFP